VIGHANLELAWPVAPVVLLAAIAAFVFYKVSDIQGAPSAAGIETIRIEAHQYYWDFVYPDGTMSVDTLHLPYRRAVRLELTSADVAHSWWVPALGGKLDAIPGRTNRLKYFPSKLGVFRGQCAEFCGLIHAAMLARVEVMPVRQYEAWRAQRRGATAELGRETFVGACAKCHGLAAQGGIGPPIAQSPILADRKALTTLIREGRGLMPAVGQDWNDEQLNATLAYLRKRFVKGGGGGG
jgi:cytochrome c oxidase subunit 2